MKLKVVEHIVKKLRKATLVAGCLSLGLLVLPSADAEPLSTDNYRLDPNVSNSFGGLVSSDSYELLDSGGEAVVGLGDSPSYKLSQGYVSQLEQSIELNLLPDGLVGYWPLNTGAGIQAYDVSANDNHGVLNGGSSWTDGKISNAVEFDGEQDYISIPDSPSLRPEELTVSAWVKPQRRSNSNELFTVVTSHYANNRVNFRLEVGRFQENDDSKPAFVIYRDGSFHTAVGQTDLPLDTWSYVAGSYSSDDGGTLRVYVDGEMEDETTGVGPITDYNSEPITIGRSGPIDDQTWEFPGAIDEVKIYDRPLGRDEIADEYSASASGLPSAFTLPRLDPGQSQSTRGQAVVRTDAGGYHIAIEQDGDLRTGQGDTIPAIESSISFPSPWNEGVTTGLGFSVLDGVQRDGKWGSEPDFEYAAIPSSSTSFHSRDGLSGGEKEVTSLEFRAGIDSTQAAGIYRNRLGFTATLKP